MLQKDVPQIRQNSYLYGESLSVEKKKCCSCKRNFVKSK